MSVRLVLRDRCPQLPLITPQIASLLAISDRDFMLPGQFRLNIRGEKFLTAKLIKQ